MMNSMTTREYNSYTTYTSANGEVRRYPVKRRYVSIRTYPIPDDVHVEIIKKHTDGVSAAQIARDLGFTDQRVRRIIKKAKAQDQPVIQND